MGVFPGGFTAAVAALSVAVLGGCGSPSHEVTATSTTASVTVTPHNNDDVGFLQKMIPHHQQGLELSMMVSSHSTNAPLIALATQIANETNPQIQGFRAQLLQWDIAPAPASNPDGMVDAATMDMLKGLSGAPFDTLWLQSMLTHHRGGVTMAQYEIAHGHSADVISVANSLVTSQQAEIDQMNRMLGG